VAMEKDEVIFKAILEPLIVDTVTEGLKKQRIHGVDVATQDRVFPHYVPNSSIKHNKSDSKDRSQEIL
jgi:hypothetical protein